jgi:type IV pilus assembly protein PilA
MGGFSLRGERGFTLIEVLVVIMVIGVLAAIALPIFLSQQEKGKDASAKTEARNLATVMESCRVGEDSYADCNTESELGSEGRAYSWGTGPGQVSVVSAAERSFTIEAVSNGTTAGDPNVFTLARDSDGDVTRTCSGTGGCDDGSW